MNEHSKLAQSLRRLYIEKHIITLEQITEIFNNGNLTQEDYDFIIS